VLNGIIFATLCAILMKIGSVTPEITKVEIAPFWMRWQKSGYHTKYSVIASPGLIVTNISAMVDTGMGITKLT